jgi:hypothetical protein
VDSVGGLRRWERRRPTVKARQRPRIKAPDPAIGERYREELGELAQLLIERYGERAISYAQLQALRANAHGDTLLGETWRLVSVVCRQILLSEPE